VHIVLGPKRSDDVVRLEQLVRYAMHRSGRTDQGSQLSGKTYRLETHALYAEDFLRVFDRILLWPRELGPFQEAPAPSRSVLVPARWRRIVALAIYLYPRAGELRVLRWEDVDLEHRTVHVHRARDRQTGLTKATKTKHSRRFSIEPALVPLPSPNPCFGRAHWTGAIGPRRRFRS
jgi:integrase